MCTGNEDTLVFEVPLIFVTSVTLLRSTDVSDTRLLQLQLEQMFLFISFTCRLFKNMNHIKNIMNFNETKKNTKKDTCTRCTCFVNGIIRRHSTNCLLLRTDEKDTFDPYWFMTENEDTEETMFTFDDAEEFVPLIQQAPYLLKDNTVLPFVPYPGFWKPFLFKRVPTLFLN